MQYEGESLYEVWERYKEILGKCPHHGLLIWLQVQTFYNGLEAQLCAMVNVAFGGTLMSKRVEDI